MLVLNLDKNWKYQLPYQDILLRAEQFVFSGGEVHIKLDKKESLYKNSLILHRINNSQNLMELLLAADAIRRNSHEAKINAFIPYLPYARQDRPMIEGE